MSPSEPHSLRSARDIRQRARSPSAMALSLRLTLRLEVGERAMLGPGKVRLLELIGETGSISAAGRAMGMSYRRAWSLVEDLNTAFVTPLVEARSGGTGGGGASLLPLGTEIVGIYRALEREATSAGAPELQRLKAVLLPSV